MTKLTEGYSLLKTAHQQLFQQGRFIGLQLLTKHRVLSSCSINGGLSDNLEFLVNHQSCDPIPSKQHSDYLNSLTAKQYHQQQCLQLAIPADTSVLLNTAVNINNHALQQLSYKDLTVTVVATAGVESNAVCAGDTTTWYEADSGIENIETAEQHQQAGTINFILLINQALSKGAITRAAVTLTEAKSATLQSLQIASNYSEKIATGTGTDQFIIASTLLDTLGNRLPEKQWSGGHSKLGELIAKCADLALRKALMNQNGFDQVKTQHFCYALQRFSITVQNLQEQLQQICSADIYQQFIKNQDVILQDPELVSIAYAFAAIEDNLTNNNIASQSAQPQRIMQSALLSSSLSGNMTLFNQHLLLLKQQTQLQCHTENELLSLVSYAFMLGLQDRWSIN